MKLSEAIAESPDVAASGPAPCLRSKARREAPDENARVARSAVVIAVE